MKKFAITLNGFHGYETHTVLVDAKPETCDGEAGYSITPTRSGAKRFGCRISSCTCGEGLMVDGDPMTIWISPEEYKSKSVEVSGNYPQS